MPGVLIFRSSKDMFRITTAMGYKKSRFLIMSKFIKISFHTRIFVSLHRVDLNTAKPVKTEPSIKEIIVLPEENLTNLSVGLAISNLSYTYYLGYVANLGGLVEVKSVMTEITKIV